MNLPNQLRLAVSGTYSTGKTTTTEALSRWVGIAHTEARTMRELLPEAYPGKALEDCRPAELFQLGMMRFTERAVRESAMTGSFVSDGSSLHEWVYGRARMEFGIRPGEGRVSRVAKRLFMAPYRPLLNEINDAFGAVVKRHALTSYDEFIHLPVEFPLRQDGHRPVSEPFRALSDDLLRHTLDELGIKYHVVPGTLAQRLMRIAEIYHLEPVMPLAEAIFQATLHVRELNRSNENAAQAQRRQAKVQH